MKTVLYKSSNRGSTKINWLDSKHSFSFGEYYNSDNVHFGALRVLNDDIVEPGKGSELIHITTWKSFQSFWRESWNIKIVWGLSR